MKKFLIGDILTRVKDVVLIEDVLLLSHND